MHLVVFGFSIIFANSLARAREIYAFSDISRENCYSGTFLIIFVVCMVTLEYIRIHKRVHFRTGTMEMKLNLQVMNFN